MRSETKRELLKYFGIREPAQTRKGRETGKQNPDRDGWDILHYIFDNLDKSNEELTAHLCSYINPHKRANWIGARLYRNDDAFLYKANKHYFPALKEANSIFRDGSRVYYKHAANLGLSKEQYISEVVKYTKCMIETYLYLHAGDEVTIGSLNEQEKSSMSSSNYTLSDIELLETLKQQGFLQCDIDR